MNYVEQIIRSISKLPCISCGNSRVKNLHIHCKIMNTDVSDHTIGTCEHFHLDKGSRLYQNYYIEVCRLGILI